MDVLDRRPVHFNHDAARQGPLMLWKDPTWRWPASPGRRHALAVSSGSTAVSTMLAACGVGYGDEGDKAALHLHRHRGGRAAGRGPARVRRDRRHPLHERRGHPQGVISRRPRPCCWCTCAAPPPTWPASWRSARSLRRSADRGQCPGARRHLQGSKPLGRWGRMGSYSYDFFKITTAGEGAWSSRTTSSSGTPPSSSPTTGTTTSATTGAWSSTRSCTTSASASCMPRWAWPRRASCPCWNASAHKAAIQERLSASRGWPSAASATMPATAPPSSTCCRPTRPRRPCGGEGARRTGHRRGVLVRQHVPPHQTVGPPEAAERPYRMVAHELGLPQDLRP